MPHRKIFGLAWLGRLLTWLQLYCVAVVMYLVGKLHQYRWFGVGATGFGMLPDGTLVPLSGHNRMGSKGGPKCCAELDLVQKAAKLGCVKIVVLVVVGKYQPDDTSGHNGSTLHPCCACRTMLAEHPLTRDGTPIITALPPHRGILNLLAGKRVHERHTPHELLGLHNQAETTASQDAVEEGL